MGKAGATVKKAAASASKGSVKVPKKAATKSTKNGSISVHLECHEGSSNKFYRMILDGTTVTSTYGRCGTDGQETVKQFPSEDKVRIPRDAICGGYFVSHILAFLVRPKLSTTRPGRRSWPKGICSRTAIRTNFSGKRSRPRTW